MKLTYLGVDGVKGRTAGFTVTQPNILLIGGMGSGKAQPLDCNILTPVGWRRMGDIRVGDAVINPCGGHAAVTGVFPQGEKDVYKITFSDGSSTQCCEEHLWQVQTPKRKHCGLAPRVLSLRQIMDHGLVDGCGNSRFFVPMVVPVSFVTDERRPIDPYLLGALLGDGSLGQKDVTITSADDEIAQLVGAACGDLGVGIRGSRKRNSKASTYRFGSPRPVYVKRDSLCGGRLGNLVSAQPNSLMCGLRSLGLVGRRSHDKFIPPGYLYASVDDRLAVLQGLCDTDGYACRHGAEFTTVSPQLAADVRFLVLSLGGKVATTSRIPTCVYKGSRRDGQRSYRLYFSLPAKFVPFRLTRKRENYAVPTKYSPTRAIVRVEPAGMAPCQCISVDSKESLYVTDDFIVTHNTAVIDGLHLLLLLPLRFGDRGLEALSPTGSWSVTGEFDHPDVRRLRRAINRGKAVFEVNAKAVKREQYEQAVKQVLDVDPHHVVLGEFLNLSGQKRAALFSQMLDASDATRSIDDMMQVIEKRTLAASLNSVLGEQHQSIAVRTIDDLAVVRETPAGLVEAMRKALSDRMGQKRDAEAALEKLYTTTGTAATSQTPVEIQAKIKAIDESLGGIKQRARDAVLQKERYDAANKLVAAAEESLTKTKANLEKQRAIAATRADHQKAAGDLEEAIAHARIAITECSNDVAALREGSKAMTDDRERLVRARQLLTDLLKQKWDVPADWLEEEFQQMAVKVGVAVGKSKWEPEEHRAVIDFTQEVVKEVLGGDLDRISEKVESLDSQIAAEQEKINAAQVAEREAKEKIDGTMSNPKVGTRSSLGLLAEHEMAVKAIAACEQAAQQVVSLEQAIGEQEQKRISVQDAAQKIMLVEDDEIVAAQLQAAEDERKVLSDALRKLDEAKAITGQIENQRLEVARLDLLAAALQRLVELSQRWRDGMVRDRISAVMEPFEANFKLLWGEEARVIHRSAGEGRSTEFDFAVRRVMSGFGEVEVGFDLLSDGETILTAAAFLAAMQQFKLKQVPPRVGSLLTLNSEALSFVGLRLLLERGPSLGLDAMLVANNRAEDVIARFPEAAKDWQIIDMGTPPRERI